LFLDLDGTLLDIAATPQGVEVHPTTVPTLARLSRGLAGALAILSGRAIADIDRLLAPLRLPAAGQHGAELRLDPAGPIERAAFPPRPHDWDARLAALAREHTGLLLEDKGLGVAVHYRNAPAAEPTVRRVLRGLVDGAQGFALKSGKCVWEILPRGCDKGAALRRLMAAPPFAGRLPVVLGDDVTDEDAFRAAVALGGHAVRVGPPSAAATATLAGPRAVRDWLAAGAVALAGEETPA